MLKNLDMDNDALCEVIISDSSDIPLEIEYISELKYLHPKLKIISSESRQIPSSSRNIGAAQASGDYLLFIDSDAYPHQSWIDEILDSINKGFRAGGGSISLPPFQKKNLLAVSQYFLQFNEFLPRKGSQAIRFSPSCNLYCERELFHSIGGFPDIRASEDVLFGMKINESDSYWYNPEATVYHIFGTDKNRFRSNQKLLGEYVARYRKKEYGAIRRSVVFQILLFPFIPIIKTSLMVPRICRSGSSCFLMYLRALPGILAGLWYWSLGYMKGIFQVEEIYG